MTFERGIFDNVDGITVVAQGVTGIVYKSAGKTIVNKTLDERCKEYFSQAEIDAVKMK